MTVPLEQFVKQLEDSGILAGDTLRDFLPPKAAPQDAEALARELIRHRKLTKFQAEEVSRGKGKSLILGNYVLMEQIGAGGMGQVFKARHQRMDRLVAVKILPSAMMKDRDAVARFEREVKVAAKINHPNIVTAYDADQANGVHFLVMELVDGSDLTALVRKQGPLPVEKAVDYILQAAKGLDAAHKQGIIHRDVKPSNLLLDKAGTVRILDMGLARIEVEGMEGVGQGSTELTGKGMVLGTVDYMSPEQSLNTSHVDARADIYSLGCSLYYLLVGKPVYRGDTAIQKIVAHRESAIPSLCSARADVPAELDAVFRKMVAKNVEQRYQSLSEVMADLERPPTVQETPAGAALENSAVAFFQNLPSEPSVHAAKANQGGLSSRSRGQGNQLLLYGTIGAAVLAAAIVAAVFVSQPAKDAQLRVDVDQSDAVVEVSDLSGQVEIVREDVQGPLTLTLKPGRHRLKVKKEGFADFAEEFELAPGGSKSIASRLKPVKEDEVKISLPELTPERQLAQWVLGKGGTVTIKYRATEVATTVRSFFELPDDGFNFDTIDLRKVKLADRDLPRFHGATFRVLKLPEGTVTKEAVAALRKAAPQGRVEWKEVKRDDAKKSAPSRPAGGK